jgi:hypothetical protein
MTTKKKTELVFHEDISDPEKYILEERELRNLVDAFFMGMLGCRARDADFAVIRMVAFGTARPEVRFGLKVVTAKLAEPMAEYVWDHWLGEPDAPSQTRVAKCARDVVAAFFRLDRHARTCQVEGCTRKEYHA